MTSPAVVSGGGLVWPWLENWHLHLSLPRPHMPTSPGRPGSALEKSSWAPVRSMALPCAAAAKHGDGVARRWKFSSPAALLRHVMSRRAGRLTSPRPNGDGFPSWRGGRLLVLARWRLRITDTKGPLSEPRRCLPILPVTDSLPTTTKWAPQTGKADSSAYMIWILRLTTSLEISHSP